MLKTIICSLLLAATLTAGPALAEPLKLLPGKSGPALTEVVTVLMDTDAGPVTIEVYPQAAPNAAKRFLELVELGFYDNTPIFRVVKSPKPFVAQFGINSKFADWENKSFKDDPSLYQLGRGTLAFAKGGPDTNSTQVFINYVENNRLTEPELNFSAFAQVVSGMENADSFKSVGDERMGLDQDTLWKNSSVEALAEKPNIIRSAKIVEAGDSD